MPGLLPRGEVGETGEGQQHRAGSTARGDAPSRGWAKRGFRGGEEGGKRGGATKRAEVAKRKPRGRSPGGSRGREFRFGGDLVVGWASVARARRYKPLFVCRGTRRGGGPRTARSGPLRGRLLRHSSRGLARTGWSPRKAGQPGYSRSSTPRSLQLREPPRKSSSSSAPSMSAWVSTRSSSSRSI